jgi:hypothetical protein
MSYMRVFADCQNKRCREKTLSIYKLAQDVRVPVNWNPVASEKSTKKVRIRLSGNHEQECICMHAVIDLVECRVIFFESAN